MNHKNPSHHIFALTVALSLSALLVACTGSSTTTPTTPTSSSCSTSGTASVTATTTGVLCSETYSGSQLLVYNNSGSSTVSNPVSETLAYNATWSCTSSQRALSSNGVPNHVTTNGNFATKISAQSVSASYTITPSIASSCTTTNAQKLPGYALNGVKLDPATAGTCPTGATSVSNCNYAGGTGAWNMVAVADPTASPWKFDFGTDTSNAHVQPGGAYHYHGIPTELMPKLNPNSTTTMTLVGWARDGYPIYAKYGYTTATDTSSALKEMKSSYVANATSANRPSSSNFPAGHFEQDWVYSAGSGDLDECNGRTGKTPEFPNGIYHYYITSTYPFIQRCVKGVN